METPSIGSTNYAAALMQSANVINAFGAMPQQLGRPDRRKRDLDNLMKPVLDLLQHYGVIDNDSLAQHVSIHWSDTIQGAHVVLSKWGVREAARAA